MPTPGTLEFPTALDGVVSLFEVNNRAYTTLSADINNSVLAIPLTDSTVFPTTGVVTLTDSLTAPTKHEEIIFTANAANSLTVPVGGRGAFGSTAQNWSGTVYVRMRMIAEHHEVLRDGVIQLETKVGYGAATPTVGKFLVGNTTAGTSTWRVLAAGDIPDLSATYEPANANIQSHISSTSNPHSVTKSQVGLGNVENTALSTWAGSANLTTLGTIATGTWNGSVIGSNYGGAGSINGILKANGSGVVSAAVAGTDYLSATAPGSNKQVIFNSSGAYSAAAGFEYQSGASPNVSITAQNDSHSAIIIRPFSDSYSEYPFQLTPASGIEGISLKFEPNQSILGQGNLLLIGSDTAITPTFMIAGVVSDPSDGTARSRLIMEPSLDSDTFFLFDTIGVGFADTNYPELSESVAFRASAVGGLNLLNETGDIAFIAGGDSFANDRLRVKSAGIIVNGGALDASAVFQINSTTQGFLPPRMTETERDAIASPAEGLIVHNLTTNAPNYYDGSAWAAIGASNPFDDATAIVKGSADATKLLRIEVDGLTTATTRVWTAPDANLTVAGIDLAQTWTANQTFGSGILRATSPQITTGINDSNGASLIAVTATGSAIFGLTLANAASGGTVAVGVTTPTQAASAIAGTPLSITASAAVAGSSNVGAAAGGSVTITAGNAARLTSGNANGGSIFLVTGSGVGTGTSGQVVFPLGGSTAPGITFTGDTNTGFYAFGNDQFAVTLGGNLVGIFSSTTDVFRLGQGGQFNWSNSSNPQSSFGAAGLTSNASATVRVTNGSTGAGSLIIGTSTVGSIGTSGVGVLAVANGTAPSSSPADEFQLYSADWNGAGTAAAHFRNEQGHVIKIARAATYTPTNVSTDRSYDANATTLDELADVVGTLIADLQTLGFLG